MSRTVASLRDGALTFGVTFLLLGGVLIEGLLRHLAVPLQKADAAVFMSIFILGPWLTAYIALRRFAVRSPQRARRFRSALGALAVFSIALNGAERFYTVRIPLAEPLRVLAYTATLIAGAVLARAAIRRFRGRVLAGTEVAGVVAAVIVLIVGRVMFRSSTVNLATPPSHLESASTLPPVFILIFDELSQDALLDGEGHIDSVRYPNLAAFAREGVAFTNATTTYHDTLEALPGLVESLGPLFDQRSGTVRIQYAAAESALLAGWCGVRVRCDGIHHLVKVHAGEALRFHVARALLTILPLPLSERLESFVGPTARAAGFPIKARDDAGGQAFTERHFAAFAAAVPEAVSTSDAQVMHTLLTHPPLVFDREGPVVKHGLSDRDVRTATFHEVESAYIAQIEYADMLFGEFVAALKATGAYDRAVIVVTADHGLRLRIRAGPDMPVDHLMTHIPFIIRAPSVTPGESSVAYEHADFGATILDVLGIPSAATGGARSAFDPVQPPRQRRFVAENRWTWLEEEDGSWRYAGEDRAPAPGSRPSD